MRLVSEQSEEDIQRRRTSEDLVWQLRELAAHILRITRGSGEPQYLHHWLLKSAKAFEAYAKAHGSMPSGKVVRQILDCEAAWHEARPWIAEERKKYAALWEANGEIDRSMAMREIRHGALQVAASMLMDQLTQLNAGEHQIYEGVRTLEEARATRRAYDERRNSTAKGSSRRTRLREGSSDE